jgi:hypothetical protein
MIRLAEESSPSTSGDKRRSIAQRIQSARNIRKLAGRRPGGQFPQRGELFTGELLDRAQQRRLSKAERAVNTESRRTRFNQLSRGLDELIAPEK